MSVDRAASNRCRFVPEDPGGHYESYFLRANHPLRPLGFWIRYTVFSPKGRPRDAVGELWAIYFDGERARIAVAKEVFPIRACEFSRSGLEVRIGEAVLREDRLAGRTQSRAQALQWELRYAGSQPPLLLLPAGFYERGFSKAKALVGTPNAVFEGVLTVNGETIAVERWVGSQNHNWGRRHTDSYAWGQVCGFDGAPDTFLECATARLRLGPYWSPALTMLVLRTEEGELRLNGLAQALRAHGEFDFRSWRIESATSKLRVSAFIEAPKAAFVGLLYDNPPGGRKICLNTKLAACELVLEQAGRSKRRLTTKYRAAFEILTDGEDHGVAIAA